MESPGGLEHALARAEQDLEAAVRVVAGVIRELKRGRAAAATGQSRELRRSLTMSVTHADELAAVARKAESAYDVDEADLLASGAYSKELLAAAEEAGLSMVEEDDRLLSYPSIVRLLPAEAALEVDRKRVRGIRPSAVVAALLRVQQAGPRFRPEPFVVSLAAAYDLTVAKQGKAPGAVVRLVDVYTVLTLLPGQAREYSRAEFARDLYLLDQTGAAGAPGGRRLRWAASTGTRQAGVLTTVAKNGQQQRYWGIAFEEPTP